MAPLHVAYRPENRQTPTQASSLHAPQERLQWSNIEYPYTITVETITIDSWATQNNIAYLDLLWLDLQGHELTALQGAQQMLKKVKVVYTEVNFVHAYKNQQLYTEIDDWMLTQYFVPIAKDFADTAPRFFGNMLFIQKES